MSILHTIGLLLIFSYFVLYLGGRKYWEHFENKTKANVSPNVTHNFKISPPEKPYAMNQIEDIDDYEVSAVFHNRGSREASQKQINDAMTRYPIDWSVQGPQSQVFQENAIQSSPTYSAMNLNDAVSASPMELNSNEEEEKKILQTYRPKKCKELLEYSVEDVKHMIERIYTKRGLVPTIEKSKQGANIWEITEVQEKNPKIIWDDDVENDKKIERAMEQRGENVIDVPQEASDIAAGLDPFFQTGARLKKGRNDYTHWTPGLERMFAPTYPVKHWY
jgi:hypothetical protein